MLIKGKILDDILIKLYPMLLESTDTFSSTRGNGLDHLGALLELENPRARISASLSRGKFITALGEFCWYMHGSQASDDICYYIPPYKDEVQDGVIKGAYGPRLMGTGTNGKHSVNQIKRIIELLKKKPDSRRAVITLLEEHDLAHGRKEAPCTTNLQFILRRGRLHLITSMRSNDAYMGLPHDFFCFTMIQELIARSLGVKVGNYKHFAASLHLYEEKLDGAKEYVDEGWQSSTFAMPMMPTGCQFKNLGEFLNIEKAIRLGKLLQPSKIDLNPYWKDLALLLLYFSWHNKERYDGDTDELIDCFTSKFYTVFVKNRLPQTQKIQTFNALPKQLSMEKSLEIEERRNKN